MEKVLNRDDHNLIIKHLLVLEINIKLNNYDGLTKNVK